MDAPYAPIGATAAAATSLNNLRSRRFSLSTLLCAVLSAALISGLCVSYWPRVSSTDYSGLSTWNRMNGGAQPVAYPKVFPSLNNEVGRSRSEPGVARNTFRFRDDNGYGGEGLKALPLERSTARRPITMQDLQRLCIFQKCSAARDAWNVRMCAIRTCNADHSCVLGHTCPIIDEFSDRLCLAVHCELWMQG